MTNNNKSHIVPPPPRELPLSKIILTTVLAFSLILSLSLSACKDGSGNGGDRGGEITGDVIAQGVQVKDSNTGYFLDPASLPDYTGTKEFAGYYLDGVGVKPLTSLIPGSSVKVTNGKLNMTLGVPKAEYLITGIGSIPSGITVSDLNAKSSFSLITEDDVPQFITTDEVYGLFLSKSADAIFAFLLYVDRDVTVKGTYTRTYDSTEYTSTYDCTFKKGWNYLIFDRVDRWTDDTHTKITASQSHPSGFYWVIFKDS